MYFTHCASKLFKGENRRSIIKTFMHLLNFVAPVFVKKKCLDDCLWLFIANLTLVNSLFGWQIRLCRLKILNNPYNLQLKKEITQWWQNIIFLITKIMNQLCSHINLAMNSITFSLSHLKYQLFFHPVC